jgi:prepilin-type N-terminal cleavage/methylation domain-containing protein
MQKTAYSPFAWRRRVSERRGSSRAGFTLIEVLVATAVTLLMMISLAKIFKIIGDSMQEGRATLELNNRLRNVALRIQRDLRSVTVTPESNSEGYFEYFDGAQTDYTAGLATAGLANRFGDLDDIVMLTARADDVWFTGKVPLFVLRGGASGLADDFNLVTVASQYAEIAFFVQPIVATQVGSGTAAVQNPGSDPALLVQDPWAFQNLNFSAYDPTLGNVGRLPAGYRLHYRVLLVRPDLNVGGVLPSATHPVGGDNWLVAQPQSGVLPGTTTTFALPSPLCDMARAFSQCDLSMRRVEAAPGVDGLPAGADRLAANDLQTLSDPANRFAHVKVPIPGAAARTMPLLALGPQLQLDFDGDDQDDIQDPDGSLGGNTFRVGSGFLHPAYTLHTVWDAANPTSALPSHQLTAARVGEDILASDILAFDAKGFDPGVPLIASFGGDAEPGIAGVDDDLDTVIDRSGTVPDLSEVGWDGSDDQLLSPNDPGYGPALVQATSSPVTAATIATGEYVDLGWARKTLLSLSASGIAVPGSFASPPNLWTQLSGYDGRLWPTQAVVGPPFTDDLYRSGKVLQQVSSGNELVIQFTADSSDYRIYETDGIVQAQITGLRGTTELTGTPPLLNDPIWARLDDDWRGSGPYLVDAAIDGLDNNLQAGLDDITERETASPFAVNLRGVKISIRMEDPATKIMKQMSIGKEFITTR